MNSARVMLFGLLSLLLPTNQRLAADDDAYRFVLTDSASNHWVRQTSLGPKNFEDVAKSAHWTITKEVLHGGKQEGVDLVTVHNGKMVIRVIPTRGMNIFDLHVGDFRLGWNSPVKEIVNPQFIHLDTRGGLGWLDGFNEWMVRCGLEFAGHPGKDEFITNTGATAEMDLTLHGKIGNTPASLVEVLIEKAEPHRITLRGIVHERMFFGPKFQLVTEISTLPESMEITVTDRITNLGAGDQEFELIYHTNYGAPMLEQGAFFLGPVKKLMPMNDTAVSGLDAYSEYAGPTPGFTEQVFLTELFADDHGQTTVCLCSKDRTRATSISYDTRQLPFFTLWKNTTAAEDGYVTGLEPGTAYPFNRKVERSNGRIPKLNAGETRVFSLTYGLHFGKEAVEVLSSQIKSLQAGRKTEVIQAPPETLQ